MSKLDILNLAIYALEDGTPHGVPLALSVLNDLYLILQEEEERRVDELFGEDDDNTK